MKLMKRMGFGFNSIIKKYPMGLGNRMRKFDEWSLTGNHPQVKTYYDYFYIKEREHLNLIFLNRRLPRVISTIQLHSIDRE